MRTLLKPLIILFLGGLIIFSLNSSKSLQNQPNEWNIPPEYKTMKNPVKVTEQVKAEGKALFHSHCASCHGETGKGDGEKARNMEKIPANLTLNKIKDRTDGEHFYIIKIGRKGLHAFKGKLTDDEIWRVISYVNTFHQ